MGMKCEEINLDPLKQAILNYQAQIQIKYIRNKLSKGKCGWSGCNLTAIKYYCNVHRLRKNVYNRKRIAALRDARVAEHLCIHCGIPNNRPLGTRYCTKCLVVSNRRIRERLLKYEVQKM